MTKSGERLIAAVKQAREDWQRMTPEQRDEMLAAQTRSYVRAEVGFGSDADEAEYRAAMESGCPKRIAEVKAKEAQRLAAFDSLQGETKNTP